MFMPLQRDGIPVQAVEWGPNPQENGNITGGSLKVLDELLGTVFKNGQAVKTLIK